MMHRRHKLLHAVKKSTREVIGEREGLRERNARWEIHHFSGVHRLHTHITHIPVSGSI